MVESVFDPSEEEVNQFHQKALDKVQNSVQTLNIGIKPKTIFKKYIILIFRMIRPPKGCRQAQK